MSTSEPSPPTEVASSPTAAVDPLREDSAKAADPLAVFDEPKESDSDLSVFDAVARPVAKPVSKREPTLAESSIFDVSEADWSAFDPPVIETPADEPAVAVAAAEEPAVEPRADAEVSTEEAPVLEASPIEASAEEASAVEESPVEESPEEVSAVDASPEEVSAVDASPVESSPLGEELADELPPEEKPASDFGDLAAFDGLSKKPRIDPIIKSKPPLPPLLPTPSAEPPTVSLKEGAAEDDDGDEAEWELGTGELSTIQSDEVTEAVAKPPDRPWRDVDDLEDEDDDDEEDSDELTGVVAKEESAPDAAPAKRPWRDVDDLEDDDDDPSEHLPTRVLGAPAPAVGQRTVVPPPPARGAAGSRGPSAPSLPAIPPPPTLPRTVPPSIPPVALDWILPRVAKRAGSLTAVLAGLVLLVVAIVPLVALGALVTGAFSPARGSLVVTVAGANHGPVDSPVIVIDDVPRCKQSPCRVGDLEPGTHFVRVSAPGYLQMAPRAVSVEKGGEVVQHVELAREPSRVTVAENAAPKASAPLDLDDPSVKAEALPRSGSAAPPPSQSLNTSTSVASRAAAAPQAAAGGDGRLNLSSTPPSNVVLDGRPLGVTPRSNIKVKAGAHSVVFIHPKLGRKNARANVKPGATSNVSVRFR